ncbi:MAG: hypothetical protein AAFP69_19430, partial [Planctomycetota bacterium]
MRSSLGLWSSHPRQVARRTRYAAIFALVPLALLLGLSAYVLLHPSTWYDTLVAYRIVLLVVACVGCFTISAFVTLALMARLNRWQHDSDIKHLGLDAEAGVSGIRARQPRIPLDPYLLVPAALLAFVGPYLLASQSELGPVAIWLFRFLPFLPLFALLSLLNVGGQPKQSDDNNPNQTPAGTAKRQWWLLIVSIGCMFAAIVVTARDICQFLGLQDLAQSITNALPALVTNQRPFIGAIVFGIPAMITYGLWRLWKSKPTSGDSREEINALWRELMHDGATPELDSDQTPLPEWIENISGPNRSEPQSWESSQDQMDAEDGSSSRPDVSQPSIYDLLFLRSPSDRQIRELERCILAHNEFLVSDPRSPVSRRTDITLDLEETNEATAVLAALSIYHIITTDKQILWTFENQ